MYFRLACRISIGLATFVFAIGAFIVARTDPDALTTAEVAVLTESLNEAAAIGVPHGFLADEALKEANSGLLADVESGVILSKDNSVRYRHLFQGILHKNQNYLTRFDAQLSVIADHAMQTDNNTQGQGISGHHDHHDLSARANFEAMLLSIEKLNASRTFIGRIVYANSVQKDLVDLISHIGVAPNTVSVAYEAPDKPWPNLILGAQFEAMLKAYKSAQFEFVNSPQYWAAIDQGQFAYSSLILSVQDIVFSKTTRWERRIAGRFLSLQTLSPPVELVPSKRRI